VEMLGQILPPGVQDRRHPDLATQMPGIAGESGEGLCGRANRLHVTHRHEPANLAEARGRQVERRVSRRVTVSAGRCASDRVR
jgi:hypothetical protein